jgi:predicted HicB family RNase H-like nuclease
VSGKKKEKEAPKRRPSGPSGSNLLPRFTLRATQEEFDSWRDAAEAAGLPLNQWIRDACTGAEVASWPPPALRKR